MGTTHVGRAAGVAARDGIANGGAALGRFGIDRQITRTVQPRRLRVHDDNIKSAYTRVAGGIAAAANDGSGANGELRIRWRDGRRSRARTVIRYLRREGCAR